MPILMEGVIVSMTDDVLTIKGAKGEVNLSFPHHITAEVNKEEKTLTLIRKGDTAQRKMMHGTFRSLVANAIVGVTEGFSKTLVFKGVGYKAEVSGNKLVLNVGYSHLVEFMIVEGIEIKIDGDKIEILGTDKQLVGETAAKIREIKIADVYKGHGLRYSDEHIKLKPGKAAAKGTEGAK